MMVAGGVFCGLGHGLKEFLGSREGREENQMKTLYRHPFGSMPMT
jgi:hypothetical protein